jgi:chemotaxis protein methyltransferase CheR
MFAPGFPVMTGVVGKGSLKSPPQFGETPLVSAPINDDEFDHFKKLIYRKAGIYLSDVKKPLVAGRLSKRLRHYGLNTYSQYITLLKRPGNDPEMQIMVDLLTTNETYFFREPRHFDFLLSEVLPAADKYKTFRAWSAASSSGEEAYTLAMLLAERFGFSNWEILATDISSRVLETARKGIYSTASMAKIPKSYVAKYCLKGVRTQEGNFSFDSQLKNLITFQSVNLNETLPEIGFFDVIMLRNVMIYFNAKTKQQVVNRVVQRLKTGGYLFIGHSETLNGVTDKVKMIKPSVFRKL